MSTDDSSMITVQCACEKNLVESRQMLCVRSRTCYKPCMHTRLVVHVAPISAVDKFLYKNIDAAAADAADDDDAAEPGWRHGVVHRYRCLTSSTAVVNNTQ